MIRVGRIVNVLGDADSGLFGAKRVKLALPGKRYEISAFAKKLNDTDFLVELLTALIGIEIGLPIPEPVIAITEDGKDAWFASVDVKHPDLTRRLNLSNGQIVDDAHNTALLSTLADWPCICDAIGFDEWIANGDRNTGNILYDGRQQFYLIDHNLSMRLPFAPNAPINNQLLAIKLRFTGDEIGRQRLKNQLSLLARELPMQLPRQAADRILDTANNLDDAQLTSMVDFLEKRLAHLTAITHSKIHTRQQSL